MLNQAKNPLVIQRGQQKGESHMFNHTLPLKCKSFSVCFRKEAKTDENCVARVRESHDRILRFPFYIYARDFLDKNGLYRLEENNKATNAFRVL